MARRIAVDFTGGCLKDFGIDSFGESEHIDRSVDTGFYRLHRIFLVMDGACRAGEVVNFITLDVERESDIVPGHFKTGIIQKMVDIAFCAGEKVIHTNYFIAFFQNVPVCGKLVPLPKRPKPRVRATVYLVRSAGL